MQTPEQRRIWRANNRERIALSNRQYRAKNPDKIKAYACRYNKQNRDIIALRGRIYRKYLSADVKAARATKRREHEQRLRIEQPERFRRYYINRKAKQYLLRSAGIPHKEWPLYIRGLTFTLKQIQELNH